MQSRRWRSIWKAADDAIENFIKKNEFTVLFYRGAACGILIKQ